MQKSVYYDLVTQQYCPEFYSPMEPMIWYLSVNDLCYNSFARSCLSICKTMNQISTPNYSNAQWNDYV
jgi:hypothetical protein